MNDKPGGHFALCPCCKKYSTICAGETQGRGEYSIASCSNTSCNGTVLLCNKCPQFYKNSNKTGSPIQRIMEHINKCHNDPDDDASLEDNEDACPQLSIKDRDDSDDEGDDDVSISNNSEIYEEGVDSDDDVSKSNDEEGDSNIYYDCNDFDNDDRRKDGLLCLAEQKKRHGPIRWYWEGTSERFIQQLKKVLVAMRRTPI